MCIRDSYVTGLSPTSQRAIDNLFEIVHTQLDERFDVEIIDCLLYTSDAADDLLCVDLGGRRIIKKKKTTVYYIHNHVHDKLVQPQTHTPQYLSYYPH